MGLGILLVTTPITSIFMKKIVGYRREMLKYTDQVGGSRVGGGSWAAAAGVPCSCCSMGSRQCMASPGRRDALPDRISPLVH